MKFDFCGKQYDVEIASVIESKPEVVYTMNELAFCVVVDDLEVGFYYDLQTEEIEISVQKDEEFVLVWFIEFTDEEKNMLKNYYEKVMLS